MENPLAPKPEEIAKGGQMAIVIGFVATFLLGIAFVFVLGNLLGQISDGVQAVNIEITGTKKLVVSTAANSCLYAYVATDNADMLSNTEKTDAVKTEEILNAYDSEKLSALSNKILTCTTASTPSYVEFKATSATVAKSGEGLTVEAALNNILQ